MSAPFPATRPARIFSSAVGWRLATIAAVVLGLVAAQSCERYVPEYHTQPVFDWLSTLPFQDQAVGVPDAGTLAGGVFAVRPDWQRVSQSAYQAIFQPPQVFQRTFAGERDGWTVHAASPDGADTLELNLVVFHRAEQTQAWAGLAGMEEDTGRPSDLGAGRRTSGPGSLGVWVLPPHASVPPDGGTDIFLAQGVVGLQLKLTRHGTTGAADSDPVALAALAESDARALISDWQNWYATAGSAFR